MVRKQLIHQCVRCGILYGSHIPLRISAQGHAGYDDIRKQQDQSCSREPPARLVDEETYKNTDRLIEQLDPYDGCHTPEEAEAQVNPTGDIKLEIEIVPEDQPKRHFRCHRTDILEDCTYHGSDHKDLPCRFFLKSAKKNRCQKNAKSPHHTHLPDYQGTAVHPVSHGKTAEYSLHHTSEERADQINPQNSPVLQPFFFPLSDQELQAISHIHRKCIQAPVNPVQEYGNALPAKAAKKQVHDKIPCTHAKKQYNDHCPCQPAQSDKECEYKVIHPHDGKKAKESPDQGITQANHSFVI